MKTCHEQECAWGGGEEVWDLDFLVTDEITTSAFGPLGSIFARTKG